MTAFLLDLRARQTTSSRLCRERKYVRPGLGRSLDRRLAAANIPAARLADELARLNAAEAIFAESAAAAVTQAAGIHAESRTVRDPIGRSTP